MDYTNGFSLQTRTRGEKMQKGVGGIWRFEFLFSLADGM